MSLLKLTEWCDDSPKPKADNGKHVSFAPTSNALVTNPPPDGEATPVNHKSGLISTHAPPQVTYDGTAGTGSGYVRVTGGNSSTLWHNYDANVPVADLLLANPSQQATILGAIGIARRGDIQSTGTHQRHCSHCTIHPRLTELRDEPADDNSSHHSSSKNAPSVRSHKSAPAQSPLMQRYLAAPEQPFKALSLAPSSASHQAIRGSSSSKSSHHSSSSKKPAERTELKCVSCGLAKREGADNVRHIKALADMPLCWKCTVETMGKTGGEVYFADAWKKM